MKKFNFFLIALICLLPALSYAEEAKDLAKDPVVEKRMIVLASQLRCLVCQNESLASSQADLAEDLRQEVREQIKKGMTDDQIKAYLVARYGDFVLYDPPWQSNTILLWSGPFLLLLGGLIALWWQVRKRKLLPVNTALTEEELQRAEALLNSSKDSQV